MNTVCLEIEVAQNSPRGGGIPSRLNPRITVPNADPASISAKPRRMTAACVSLILRNGHSSIDRNRIFQASDQHTGAIGGFRAAFMRSRSATVHLRLVSAYD